MGLLGFTDRITARVVSALEDESIPFSAAAMSFLGAISVRTGFEMISDPDGLKNATLMRFLHYGLFYVSVAIGVVIVLAALGRTPVVRVAKSVLPSFVVLLVVPMVDFAVSRGEGSNLHYLNPKGWDELAVAYLTFFAPQDGHGSSAGIRLEIAMVVAAGVLYLRHKKAGLPLVLLGGLAIYTVVLLNGVLPFWVRLVYRALGLQPTDFDDRAVAILSIAVYFQLIALSFVGGRRYFHAFLRDLRWTRVAHYQLFFVLGVALAVAGGKAPPGAPHSLGLVFVPLGLIPAILFAIVTNNLADVDIDRTSNPRRPLFARDIDGRVYSRTAWLFLALTFYYACLSGVLGFLSVAFFTGTYFLYSMPPVRFKRVPVLSKVVIALNTLALLGAGFGIAGGDVRELPKSLAAFVLVAFTLAVSFIDLKDYEGDKAAGIRTLPVLIGMRPAQIAMAVLFMAFYGIAYFAVDLAAVVGLPRGANLVPLAGLGAVQAYLLTRRRYREWPVFAVYLGSIVALIAYVALFSPHDLLDRLP